ncbi:hypothetical protein WICMUC_003214 [Wickerhamomyces mucosus]|uniref:Peptidase A1 domain-containing protein n=1 Tax=Wickerhamomyces mucosus TaxID=1378264 RepID=A0A9P8PM32_9ASCO|nr:hypothetical protein WICMUC_003214 [Wickerhamomyces mucosus]
MSLIIAKIAYIIAFLSLYTIAFLPIEQNRYLSSNDVYQVSSVEKSPDSFQVSKYTESKQQQVLSSSSNSSKTILNLIPGLSIIETDDNNECYFVNTTIGEAKFPLIIDTGSAYLWVYGDDCTDAACSGEILYTPTFASVSESESATSTATSTFELAYVTGTASGEIMDDNIIVNKLATTQKFKFGMANRVPDFFERYPVSGIFGFPSNDSSSIESIVSALYDSHAIGVKRFSLSLGKINENDSYLNNSGIFAIGEPVEELYTGEIHYTPLISNIYNYWLIEINSVYVNSFKLNFSSEVDTLLSPYTSREAIIDTGTTVLVLPDEDALTIHSFFTNSITDGTNFAIYCNSSLTIDFEINGKNFTLSSSDYIGAEYPTTSIYNGYCVSNIQGMSSTSQDWILGAVFLKTLYLDFNVNDQTIGFATKKENVYLTSTATSTVTATSSLSSSATLSLSIAGSSAISTSSYKGEGASGPFPRGSSFSVVSLCSYFLFMLF